MRRLFLSALLCSVPLFALDHPNFSGNWTLSLDESDFAGKTSPKSKTETIEHQDPSLTETVHEVDSDETKNGVLHLSTDGKSVTNQAFGDTTASTANWDGQDLVIHTVSTAKAKAPSFNDRWSLSLDGSILTVRRHYEGEGIRYDQMLVYHKSQSKTE